MYIFSGCRKMHVSAFVQLYCWLMGDAYYFSFLSNSISQTFFVCVVGLFLEKRRPFGFIFMTWDMDS